MLIQPLSDSSIDPLSSLTDVNPGAFGMPDWLSWTIIAILLLVSALFSASENAFSNCNKYHFKVLADQGNLTAKIIVRLTEKFEDTLVSVLVANNIVQTLMSTISAILFYNMCRQWGIPEDSPIEAVLSTVVMAACVYIISDTCPKILSKSIPNRMAVILAWPDFIISIILFPIILIFRGILKLTHKIFKIKDENILTKEDILESVDEAISDENVNNEEEQLFEENEKKILTEQAMAEGKPANIAEKMVMGRINKYYKEICLEEQDFVKDNSITVGKFVGNNGGKIIDVIRYEVGEGLEKRQENFAEEVAAQMKGE